MPLRLSVIGQSGPISEALRAAAYAVGRAIGAAGAHLYTGGRDGVMAAACEGARAAGGLTIGILPGDDPGQANPHVAVPITTGLTFEGRSQVLVHACDACIVVGGGAGTLTEIAIAYLYRKPIVALRGLGGWADQLAPVLVESQYLDHRRLTPIHFASDPEEAVALALRLAAAGQRHCEPARCPAEGAARGDVPPVTR